MSTENSAQFSENLFSTPSSVEDSDARAGLAAIYPELMRIARRLLSLERRNHSLQPTAIANEAIVRLLKRELAGEDARSLIIYGVREMQTILIDSGRRMLTRRRHIQAQERLPGAFMDISQMIHLQLCLEKLGDLNPRLRKVVELKFFLGLTIEESARFLNVAPRTVNKDWNFARCWLAVHWSGAGDGCAAVADAAA